MRRRLTLLVLATLLGTFIVAPQPAVATSAQCAAQGTMTTAHHLTALTPTATTFSITFPLIFCPTGTAGPAMINGTLTGTCSLWTAAGTATGAWGSASFSASTSTSPIWVSTSASFNFTFAVTQAVGAGFTCLGVGASTWTVVGVIVHV